MSTQVISLKTLANGAVEEQFQMALNKIMNNISDLNTEALSKRKLTLEVVFKPDESRKLIDTKFTIKEKLAPLTSVNTAILLGQDGGKVVTAELLKQIPGQQMIEGTEAPASVIKFKEQKAE